MIRRAVLTGLLLVAAFPAFGESQLTLTATAEEYVGEGILYRRLLFKDGAKTVSMELPTGWTFSSAPARLQLAPPEVKFADVVLEALPLKEPKVLDEAAMEALAAGAAQAAPPGSQAVTVVDKVVNPIVINGHESIGVILSYKVLGETFRRMVTVVNFPEVHLVLRVTAPEAQFDKMNATVRRSIMSWQWHEPGAPR